MNYRLTDFQAALGRSQLGKLERFLRARERLARRYQDRLARSPFLELPAVAPGRRHAWHMFAGLLRLDRLAADQDTLLRALRAEGIGAHLHYGLLHRHPCYRPQPGGPVPACPVAEAIEQRLVTLPLFPSMTESDQEDVLRALDKVFGHYGRP
jgi:dTDP-4-amino-4,6-dideoxygalactose transaminase